MKDSARRAMFAKKYRPKLNSDGHQEKIDIKNLKFAEPVIQIKSKDPLSRSGLSKSKYLYSYETIDGKLVYWDGRNDPKLNVIKTIER